MRQFKRSDRIRYQILRDVQSLLAQKCAANLDALVTFTEVELTADLKYATIFYSVLGDDLQKERASEYLDRITKRVQSEIGRLLAVKHTPVIKFRFDKSIEQGMKIEELLNSVSKKEPEPDNE